MKTIIIKDSGVEARIRRVTKVKNGKKHHSYVVRYNHLGERKQIWRADLRDANAVAHDQCKLIANGQVFAGDVTTNADRMAVVRANEALSVAGVPIDTACREYAEAMKVLDGKASITEACRAWTKRHSTKLPHVQVSVAVEQLKEQARTDHKSDARLKQLGNVLDRFADKINAEVETVEANIVSKYLAALPLAERSKRNHRDVIGFFNRWLILRGYLSKGEDWLEGVQKYTARKLGEISTYTPDEMKLLLSKADKRLVPFLAIAAFAGVRHAEIKRLDWGEVELADGAGESFIEVRASKAKTQTRRLVPVKDNLKAWLLLHRKKAGKVCPFENTTKQLLQLAAKAKMDWKKNAMRHSCISYRIAECGDVPRVSDESGNSVQMIRTNYLRRVKPAVAAEWFSIMPPRAKSKGRRLAIE